MRKPKISEAIKAYKEGTFEEWWNSKEMRAFKKEACFINDILNDLLKEAGMTYAQYLTYPMTYAK